MAVLHGRAGRLTAEKGGSRPGGQVARREAEAGGAWLASVTVDFDDGPRRQRVRLLPPADPQVGARPHHRLAPPRILVVPDS
jgi:hypothetical protein